MKNKLYFYFIKVIHSLLLLSQSSFKNMNHYLLEDCCVFLPMTSHVDLSKTFVPKSSKISSEASLHSLALYRTHRTKVTFESINLWFLYIGFHQQDSILASSKAAALKRLSLSLTFGPFTLLKSVSILAKACGALWREQSLPVWTAAADLPC